MSEPDIDSLVLAVTADVLGLGLSHGLTPATTLCADLRTDSLDRQSIAADLDVAFLIEIPDDDVAEWQTLADVAATVRRLKAPQSQEATDHV